MKILQQFQEILSILIIRENAPNSMQQYNKCQQRLLTVALSVAMFSTAAFLCHDAKTFEDYSDGVYATATTMSCLLISFLINCSKTKIFGLIDRLERVIEIRK